MISDKSVKIGVVTVTYNSADVLPDFFKSLWRQSHNNFVLYAVDNASADSTLSLLNAESDSRLRMIVNAENLGVAEGNNIGVRMALKDECEAVLLLNNDVAFEEDLFTKLLAGLESYSCEMTAPKITYFSPSNLLWWAGGSFQKEIGWRTHHDGDKQMDRGQYDTPRSVSYAPTCCLLVRRSVFERVGLFDPLYFVYYDDTDFMYRVHKNGCKLQYLPYASLQHKVSSLTSGDSLFAVRYCTRNRVYFWRKHFGLAAALAGSAALGATFLFRRIVRKGSAKVLQTQFAALKEGLAMGKVVYRDPTSTVDIHV